MRKPRKPLQSLDPLVAFEAAARHSSFALAAQELNVTASAISQQIRSLETQLNTALFLRGHRSVELTERGRRFQNSVTVALMHLINATSEVQSGLGAEQLEIATDTSFAAFWLMPRLEQFRAEFPAVALRLTATDTQPELLHSHFQLALLHGEGNWRGLQAEELFAEEVFPVCSPEYLQNRALELRCDNLAEADLLDLEFEHWNWMNWAIWLTEMDLPSPPTARLMSFNSYPLLIDAARRGAGLALGWRYLLDDQIAAGELLAPLSSTLKTRFAYYIAWPFNEKLPPVAAQFRDWVIAECKVQRGTLNSPPIRG